MDQVKKLGQVYTPIEIIKDMLDLIGYTVNSPENILKKHIIDNSCGNGEFIWEIIKRYATAFWTKHTENNKNKEKLKNELETYIHGIEIDLAAFSELQEQIKTFTKELRLNKEPNWKNIINKDTLEIKENELPKMDYVVGNPPYVRRHNITKTKTMEIFLKKNNIKGMYDLYLLFFFIGMDMLKENGTLAYITPISYLTAKMAESFRKKITNEWNLSYIWDLSHNKVFNKSTYPIITKITKEKFKNEVIYKFNKNKEKKYLETEFNYNNHFYFNVNDEFKKILNSPQLENKEIDIKVKNGFASNADPIFYNTRLKGEYITKCYKISTGQEYDAIFPYKNLKLVSLEEIKEKNYNLYCYLEKNQNELKKRKSIILNETDWHQYSRTQGFLDLKNQNKIVVPFLIKNNKFEVKELKKNIIPYSGYYIIYNNNEKIKNEILNILNSPDLFTYIKQLNKVKDSNYYTFSSKDLEKYIIYKLKK